MLTQRANKLLYYTKICHKNYLTSKVKRFKASKKNMRHLNAENNSDFIFFPLQYMFFYISNTKHPLTRIQKKYKIKTIIILIT